MAYSVRSSAMNSLSSVMTAPTNPSVRSSVIQSSRKSGYARSSYSTQTGGSRRLAPIKQDAVWARYKKKNEEEAREREMKKSQSVHATPSQYSSRKSETGLLARAAQSELGIKKVVLAPNTSGVNLRVHNDAPTTIPDLTSAPNVFRSPQASETSKSQTLTVGDG